MLRCLCTLSALAALAVSAGPAAANPIHYQESVSGDLSSAGQLPVLVFDIGSNTVSGTFSVFPSFPFADFDSFAFTIPAGAQFVSGGVSLTDKTGDITTSSWDLYSGSSFSLEGTLLERLTSLSPGSASLTTVPQGPGVYNMAHSQFNNLLSTPIASADYTFTFVVESTTTAVPEPASLTLMGAMVATLVGYAWRKRRPA